MPQRITGHTELLIGLIATPPIRHSKSPMMHNTPPLRHWV